MPTLTHLYRHPIKSHGFEALKSVMLAAGQTMPYDRRWAVANERAKTDGTAWAPCANFTRGAAHPALMAVTARMHDDGETITLSHPDRKDFTFQPDDTRQLTGFLAWVQPLMDTTRTLPSHIVRVDGRGMTDTDFPSISINSHASHRALGDAAGADLSPLRFRANLWIDGLDPWQEFDWIGQEIAVGDVRLKIEERIGRCKATMSNPTTGMHDVDTLKTLRTHWGHTDFGVYATVIQGGAVTVDDAVRVIT
ncbi:MAG: MOSC N-terminal beta barrel domain-containing protein [Pseudomonadota bacterium]